VSRNAEGSGRTGQRDEQTHADCIRAFVAVEVGEDVAARAAAIVDELRGAGADVKWVEPRNLHLTLKFLGETRVSDLPRLGAAFREVAGRRAPFELELTGVGAFPNDRRPRVIWLGVSEGREFLIGLARATEEACAALGWAREERPYQAHLTLGRVAPPRGNRPEHGVPAGLAELSRALEEARDARAGRMPVSRVVLVQSDLKPGGPVYTVLDTFPLGDPGSETETVRGSE
jgi:2'-5' RNA ligase